jgi:transposase
MSQQSLTLTARQRRRLQRQLRQTQDARVYRRTLAILEISRGKPITHVAQSLGVSRRIVHYWIEDYTQHHDPADLLPEDRSGRPTRWTEEARSLLQALLSLSPIERGYYAVNWTIALLQEELRHGTGECFADDTIRRELHRLGYVWKRPRYRLAPDPELAKKKANSPENSEFAASERAAG